jgi:hypothetical protein
MEHPIWKIGLFNKIDNEKVKCVECNAELKISGRSLKSLITHLQSKKHDKSEYAKKYEQLKAEASEGSSNSKITNYIIHSNGIIIVIVI